MSDATKMVKNVHFENASIKPFGPLFMTSVKNGQYLGSGNCSFLIGQNFPGKTNGVFRGGASRTIRC